MKHIKPTLLTIVALALAAWAATYPKWTWGGGAPAPKAAKIESKVGPLRPNPFVITVTATAATAYDSMGAGTSGWLANGPKGQMFVEQKMNGRPELQVGKTYLVSEMQPGWSIYEELHLASVASK